MTITSNLEIKILWMVSLLFRVATRYSEFLWSPLWTTPGMVALHEGLRSQGERQGGNASRSELLSDTIEIRRSRRWPGSLMLRWDNSVM